MTNLGLKEAKDLCDTIKASKKVPYEYKYEDTAKSVFHSPVFLIVRPVVQQILKNRGIRMRSICSYPRTILKEDK